MSNKNSENTQFLNNRLDFNSKYSMVDFDKWLFDILKEIEFNSVLDVGCGTGKQTFWFAEKLKNNGHVSSFDVSEKSIEYINSKKLKNIEAVVGSFEDIENILGGFRAKQFDLIHSCYSMYYAKEPLSLLSSLKHSLSDKGTMAVCAPYSLNTFLDFLSNFQTIGQLNWDCMEFVNDIVLNFMHMNFKNIRTHTFVNNLFVTDINDLANNYCSSTFYNADAEKKIIEEASKIISKKGFFHIRKKSKIVVAKDKNLEK